MFELSDGELQRAYDCFDKFGDVFVKPSEQGSSLGVSRVVASRRAGGKKIEKAFEYSSSVVIEKSLEGRELELSVYEYDGRLQVSAPGEILCPSGFYDYNEKYGDSSSSKTCVEAEGLDRETIDSLKNYSMRIFQGLKCRHMARIDFFLVDGREIFFNELNTFPGHTPISMFPTMMEHNGHSYGSFLKKIIERESRSRQRGCV